MTQKYPSGAPRTIEYVLSPDGAWVPKHDYQMSLPEEVDAINAKWNRQLAKFIVGDER